MMQLWSTRPKSKRLRQFSIASTPRIAPLFRYIAGDGLAHRGRQEQGGRTMELKHWLSAAGGCLALALWTMPATAAPISAATNGPKVAANGNSIVETTHWRRHYVYYPYHYDEDDADSFPRYYPYDVPSYRYSYTYPSYHYYYVYPRYRYHHHHHHHHHFRDHRRW
jgi:hypothetical protein